MEEGQKLTLDVEENRLLGTYLTEAEAWMLMVGGVFGQH